MTRFLLDETFAPITWNIGFFKAPLHTVVTGLADWRTELWGQGSVTALEVVGGLAAMLSHVEPIISGFVPPELVIPTRNSEWTAYFAGGHMGADPAPIGALARKLRCEAAMFTMIPECKPSDPDRRPNGARSILLLADHETDWLNYARSVGVAQDDRRWTFQQQGQPLAFEDTSAYLARRVKDRFTEDMLIEFAANLGLHPMQEEFYADHGVLVRTRLIAKADAFSKTLAQVRSAYALN